jgi:hypothetical protein
MNTNSNTTENDQVLELVQEEKRTEAIRNFYQLLPLYIFSFAIWPMIYLVDEAPDRSDASFMLVYMATIYTLAIGSHAYAAFDLFRNKSKSS